MKTSLQRLTRKIPRLPSSLASELGRLPLAFALRQVLTTGYGVNAFKADVLAGAVVAIVALPLSMALAIAVGVPPQHGLYTAIVAGGSVALLGGSRFQVTGPTAAFIVVLAPIVGKYGLPGLLTAGLLSGLILVLMGFARLGRWIEYIPHPVTTGFTAGIATVIFILQLKDALGLTTGALPDHFPEKVVALWHARGTASLPSVCVAAFTLLVLLGFPRLTKRVPAPLVAIVSSSILVAVLDAIAPNLDIATVGSRFHTELNGKLIPGIPRSGPTLAAPWAPHALNLEFVRDLLPSAFAIAMLGAIESLLSAVIADGMTGTRHEPNSELTALGIGNILTPLFGGIPATGALARTATNVRSGAKSPIAAFTHAVLVLLAILIAAPWVAYVPMASLAALLMLVAWNMSEVRHAWHVVRVAPRSDVTVLITCYALTVFFDMVIAITFGVLLAAVLFMRRMAELTQTRVLHGSSEGNSVRDTEQLPAAIAVYEILGPLFFGAAQRGMAALDALSDRVRIVVLDLSRVPVIDASGLVALESALERLRRARRFVILGGPLPEPKAVFDRAELEKHHENILLTESPGEAVAMAKTLVLLNPEWDVAAKTHLGGLSERPQRVL
ncbi:MAG TPA: C4-dicarboxylic acid transporter DauA [Polyangiaceae bacterium]|nr:C4-dicarboxylic acid transporter DauA [Polyangiaceae bacterium]